MAKNFGRVNVSVTASTGGLTAGLSRAGKQLRGFGAQAQGLGGSLTSALAGFVGLGRGASMAAIGVKVLGMAIKTLLGPLLIITSLVAVFSKIGSSARELDEAGKTARRLGMSMTTFQNLSQVADEAGVSVQQMSGMLTIMSRKLGQLGSGSKAAQNAFKSIGLSFADLQNLAPEDQFTLISQRIMALPTAAERTAAAMAIFGRSGATGMGLIADASSGAVAEVARLRQQLGLNLTDSQVKGIEMMNDAMGRLSMVFQGFINQFLAELAPAVTTVSNLIVAFFAENTKGWTVAYTLAMAFVGALRHTTAGVTALYGVFQVLSAVVGTFVQGALKAFEGVTWAIERMLNAMASAAESLPGFDVGLAQSLRDAQQSAASLSSSAGQEAAIWGQAAADNFAAGVENMSNPYAAFDREFARVQAQMEQAGATAGVAAGDNIAAAVRASSESLNAMVVGTSAGEEFANSIMRGFDPRLEGDKNAERTADASERTADGVEDLANELAGVGSLGVATIAV